MTQIENFQIASLVQAMLGKISPGIRAVSLVYTDTAITLYFVLEKDNPDDREAIEDIAFAFEALQLTPSIDVFPRVTVNGDTLREQDTPGRMVYLRKEA